MIGNNVNMVLKMHKAAPVIKEVIEEVKTVVEEGSVLFENWDVCANETFLALCSEDCCIYEFTGDLGIWNCYLSKEGGSSQHTVHSYPGNIEINIEHSAYGGIFLPNDSDKLLELRTKIKIRHKCIGPSWCDGVCFLGIRSGIPPDWSTIWEVEVTKPIDNYITETFDIDVDLAGYSDLCLSFGGEGRRTSHIEYILIT